ncbi:MAG: BREX-1 system adenine-specific DNA-methyltransferase PglX, partial [Polyangiaceae bacterium]|nr:BREX-1 system adenine-specific DNA-methyltransferase PglX [Polyangiaceae bacterium]
MDKETRSAIEKAAQQCRATLESEFADQIWGHYDINTNGYIAPKPGGHLTRQEVKRRHRIEASILHKRAAGMSDTDSIKDYIRDAAFTTLNRLVAIKILEVRGVIEDIISEFDHSEGFHSFIGLVSTIQVIKGFEAYRVFVDAVFRELATELKALFDNTDPSGMLWPKRTALGEVLGILNSKDIGHIWHDDETIGWFYQYFNGQDERKQLREASQTPRSSIELAIRNQFFTPRYVVQFLTDNTLGRIWYEMCETHTALADKCQYLVKNAHENFEPRPMKDPRDIKVLDPACGSGHFLLYAFDLFEIIYKEAWNNKTPPISLTTGRTLQQD